MSLEANFITCHSTPGSKAAVTDPFFPDISEEIFNLSENMPGFVVWGTKIVINGNPVRWNIQCILRAMKEEQLAEFIEHERSSLVPFFLNKYIDSLAK